MSTYPSLHAAAGTLSAPTMLQVLLVDGRPSRIDMLTMALNESWEDIAVHGVGDLATAILSVDRLQAGSSRPGLIVLAGGDAGTAIEGLRRLQGEPTTREIPVLLLCPQVTSGDYQRSVRLGAIDMLREPESLDGYLRLAAGWQALLART